MLSIQYKQPDLQPFTEEITIQDPEWVKECRIEYLNKLLIKIYKRIFFWLCIASDYSGWFRETIIEANIDPDWQESERIEREIQAYEHPTKINYDNEITEDDIEKARWVDCSQFIEIKKHFGDKKWALCPFHDDHSPSMLIYPNGRGFYCFTCNTGGRAIDLVKKLYNLTFKEAVKFLRR